VVKPFLKKKCVFFSPFLGEKYKNVNKKQQNVSLCRILHVERQKISILNVFWQFLTFGQIQDSAQNGGHLGRRQRPPSSAAIHNLYLTL